jgi:hypothetical protein
MPVIYNCVSVDAGVAQLVERNLAKVEVESSRLFSRSKYFKREAQKASLFYRPDLHEPVIAIDFAACPQAQPASRQIANRDKELRIGRDCSVPDKRLQYVPSAG